MKYYLKGGGVQIIGHSRSKNFFCQNSLYRPKIMRKIDCAHRKIQKKFFGGQKIEKNASKLGVISFNPNKIIFRGNFVRGIDCAHRKILKKFFGGQKPPKIILLGLKLTTPNFDAFFQFFDPRKNFSEFFDARNRFLA